MGAINELIESMAEILSLGVANQEEWDLVHRARAELVELNTAVGQLQYMKNILGEFVYRDKDGNRWVRYEYLKEMNDAAIKNELELEQKYMISELALEEQIKRNSSILQELDARQVDIDRKRMIIESLIDIIEEAKIIITPLARVRKAGFDETTAYNAMLDAAVRWEEKWKKEPLFT